MLFAFGDPQGLMSVNGGQNPQGRIILENAIDAAMDAAAEPPTNPHAYLSISRGTHSTVSVLGQFAGQFDVNRSGQAKVYVGVGSFLLSQHHGRVCLKDCVTSPNEKLRDHGELIGGTNGSGVSFSMTKRP
jgi:hypothetical protein